MNSKLQGLQALKVNSPNVLHRTRSASRDLDTYIPNLNLIEKLKEASHPEPVEKIERINHFLEMDALFWDRDSHGLFDYESKGLKYSKLATSGCF